VFSVRAALLASSFILSPVIALYRAAIHQSTSEGPPDDLIVDQER